MANTASITVTRTSIEGNKRITYGTVSLVSDGSNYATGGVAVSTSVEALRKKLRFSRSIDDIITLTPAFKSDLTTGFFAKIDKTTFKVILFITDVTNGDIQQYANGAAVAANTYTASFMALGV